MTSELDTTTPESFYKRFDIQIDIAETRKQFLNRVHNRIFEYYFEEQETWVSKERVLRDVADALGEKHIYGCPFDYYVKNDFHTCLRAIEAVYKYMNTKSSRVHLTLHITEILDDCEIDLGIRWQDGVFLRSGAKLLDRKLVNEPLHWLAKARYDNVRTPFEKGLSHLLKCGTNAELCSDVITDMYEALEALAKIITGKDKDLSANRDLFLKKIKTSEYYKPILKEYHTYACKFRHGLKEKKKRPKLSISEVESFVYLTGLFIRLAVEST